MSIKYNGKLIAGKYKTQIVTDATESNKGLIRIATLEEVNAGTDNTTAVTPKDLATKQNTLTAGEGIKIENGIISTESTKILTDNVTIIQNDDNTITSIGTKTKSNTNLYDWVGTEEEYNTGVSSGVITGDTQCIITDDEQELIGTVELNVPTKVSDLANDSNFVNKIQLDTKQDIIPDLDTIREGAALGSTALQSYTETDPIYTADKPNIAKTDLSNLSNIGKDKLNTSKMYTTGAVSTDVQGYNQLVEMKQNAVKTGVDVLQEGNYRTFGTPAITNDGIASGFSSNNYIQTINPINLDASFKINCKFSIGNELPTGIFLYSSDYDSNNLRITITSSAINFFQGSVTKIQGVTVNTLNKNFQLTFEKHSNTEYYIYLYDTTNSTIIFDQTITTTAGGDYKNSTFSFGKTLSANNNENTLKIDLNAFEVYSNGNLVYKPQPRIEIPYTLSKSGSKIVDAAYRDKVMKIYENEGQAGYYTIDEENENFTLPMGEIYGMIETNKNDIADIKNKYVQKSGDTMSGALKIATKNVIVPIQLEMSGAESTVAGTYINDICFYYNGKRTALIRSNHNDTIDSIQLCVINESGSPSSLLNVVRNHTTQKDSVSILNKVLSAFIISTYVNGTSGYRIWSDGYCEQWGVAPSGNDKETVTVTLLKAFKDTNYNVISVQRDGPSGNYTNGIRVINYGTGSFQLNYRTGGKTTAYWQACGYLASGQY